MGPIHPDPVSYFSAQQLVAWNPQFFCLGVENGVFDGADSTWQYAYQGLAGCGRQTGIDSFVVSDVVTDDEVAELFDGGGDPRWSKAVVVFTPPDDATDGFDADEVVIAPTSIAMTGFNGFDFHVESAASDRFS
jgi:hypothetical protein